MNRRTKALAIPPEVKKAVADRDSVCGHPCCIWCGLPAPVSFELAFSNAHFIPRSKGGLGIEENILTLCPDCHRAFDQGRERRRMREYYAMYLKSKYPEWDEKKLYFRK